MRPSKAFALSLLWCALVGCRCANLAAAPRPKSGAGFGSASGRVLFDGQGAPDIEVRLCETIDFVGGCTGQTFHGKTDKNGHYVIAQVKPGTYALAVRIFNTDKFIYPTAGIMAAAKYPVQSGQAVTLRTVNLWKTDLQTMSPKDHDTVTTAKPKLIWKAYPHASRYKVTVQIKDGAGDVASIITGKTSITLDEPLLNGSYQWKVEAANVSGVKIAENDVDSTFQITGQAGSNTVELVSPPQESTVPASGVTLKWKAHSLANRYKLYIKGVKAKEPLLSFESVKGTSYKFATPLPPDVYYWSVEADKGFDKIASSQLQHFVVK